MELDKNLISLQGTLYSFSKQGLLNRLDTVQQVLKGIKEVTENIPDGAKSKLTFLMVLYTKLSVSQKLKDDNFVGQYINTEPYFEKEFLIRYIYHLQLQVELFKVIENCPGPLSVELLEEVIKKLKEPDFCQVDFGFEHFYQLWQSIFVKICKLDTKFHTEGGTDKLRNSFLEVYNLIQEVIITAMRHDDEFDGLHLYYFFKTLLFCIKLHKTPKVSDDPIYELSTEFNVSKDSVCSNCMTDCLEKVFGKIPNILENLTIDMWMFFSECYCRQDPKNSIQLLIGDVVYNILKEVNDGSQLKTIPANVLGFLSSIAINKSDLIAKAGVNEIISNIENGEKEWYKALVRHSAFNTEESLKCLIDHLELADSDDLNVILSTSYECVLNNEKGDLNLIKTLFLNALKKTSNCGLWLMKIFENYQTDLLTTSETHEQLIETFNKISSGKNIPHSDLMLLCVQSPLDTIKNICHIAVYSSEQLQFVTESLKILKHSCNMSHTGSFTLLDYVLLKSLLEDLPDREKQSYINLVIHLGKEDILSGSFHSNLLKCLREFLENELLEKAVLCLEIVKATLDVKGYKFHKPAFLVFMCQVLGQFSWDLESFSIIKADGREQADAIITLSIDGLEQTEDGSNFEWARQEILKSWEVNQAYFCDLWFKFNSIWSGSGTFHSLILGLGHSYHKLEDLRNVLINFDQPFEVRASIILALTTLLPVLTYQRWSSVFQQLIIIWSINSENHDAYHDVLDMFGSALQILGMNLKREQDTLPCYKYCLRNYGKLAKQCCPKMNEDSLMRTFEKIFLLLGEIEEGEKRKSCWEIFPPLLMELVEGLKKKQAVETQRREIEELLLLLDLKDVAKGLLNKLY